MNRSLRKELFREIRSSVTRFLSIFVMVALGCMFLVGLRSAAPDMRKTSDEYFDGQNFMDIQILSTLGLTDEDIAAFSQTEGVEKAEGGWALDAILTLKESDRVIKAISLSPSGINAPIVVEGRLPEAADECAVEEKLLTYFDISVGDQVTITPGDQYADALPAKTFTITGVVQSPLYISIERGTSTLGDGSVDEYVLLPEDSFQMDYYTVCNVIAQGAKALDAYSAEYEDLIDELSGRLTDVAEERGTIRYERLVADAQSQVDDAQEQLSQAQSEAEEKLEDGRQQLSDARKELDDGWQQLSDAQEEYNQAAADGKQQLADARSELDNGWNQLSNAKNQLNTAQTQLDTQRQAAQQKISAAKQQLEDGKAQLEQQSQQLEAAKTQAGELEQQVNAYGDALKQQQEQVDAAEAAGIPVDTSTLQFHQEVYDAMAQKLQEAQAQIAAGTAALEQGQAQLDAAQQEYDTQSAAAQSQLAAAQSQIDSGWSEYNASRETLNQGESDYAQAQSEYETQIADGETQLADSKQQLEDGEQEYQDSQKELEDAQTEADQKIADGQQEIDDAQKKIQEIEPADVYVLDRGSNYGFVSYDQNAQRMDNLANMFPVIFFIVAALVCLTTMTRMVEEERTEIGSIKAMGYGTGTIAMKFILYGAIAAIGGGIVGTAIGATLIPWVIFTSYGIMYTLPSLHLELYLPLSLGAIGAGVACTVGATLWAMLATARETPAALMRPKAPKAGKRILLEHIPFIWKHFRFSAKVSCRNLFRYKKRFFMTVIGIAGCTALMIAGLGLRTSIFSIIDIQYGDIYRYDLQVSLDTAQDNVDNAISQVENDENTVSVAEIYTRAMTASSAQGSQDGYITVTDDPQSLYQQVALRDMDGNSVELSDDGVVISEKLAELLDLSVGDTITLECGKKAQAVITGVTEHYVRHYVYMTAAEYEALFGETPEANELLVTAADDSDSAIEKMSGRLMENGAITAVSNIGAAARSFEKNMQAVNAAVTIIIFSAAALALVVLYNLTNINITERIRELATIKVLGFYDHEVAMYIYRENIILTILGIALGQVFGKYLCTYLIRTIELDFVMFGRQAKGRDYLLSVLLSLIFALAVNFLMYFRMKKIDMVQSLKSVE